MIRVMCSDTTKATIKIGELEPFQGDLKKRTEKDIKELQKSLKEDGMQMPFVVWPSSNGNKLLDGHSRLAALTELMLLDESIATQDFPVIYIQAETEEQARKSLLQITSSYGRITKQGAIKFCATIPNYRAPAVNKFVHTSIKKQKVEEHPVETVIRIAVANDKVDAVLDLFKQVNYIRVIK